MDIILQIKQLREELERHNYNYYVLSNPTISDREFDEKMHLLERLENENPESYDPTSPTQRVGSDITKEFLQVPHRYHNQQNHHWHVQQHDLSFLRKEDLQPLLP